MKQALALNAMIAISIVTSPMLASEKRTPDQIVRDVKQKASQFPIHTNTMRLNEENETAWEVRDAWWLVMESGRGECLRIGDYIIESGSRPRRINEWKTGENILRERLTELSNSYVNAKKEKDTVSAWSFSNLYERLFDNKAYWNKRNTATLQERSIGQTRAFLINRLARESYQHEQAVLNQLALEVQQSMRRNDSIADLESKQKYLGLINQEKQLLKQNPTAFKRSLLKKNDFNFINQHRVDITKE